MNTKKEEKMEENFEKAKKEFLAANKEVNSLPIFEEMKGSNINYEYTEEQARKEILAYGRLRKAGKVYYKLLGEKLGWGEELIKRKIASL